MACLYWSPLQSVRRDLMTSIKLWIKSNMISWHKTISFSYNHTYHGRTKSKFFMYNTNNFIPDSKSSSSRTWLDVKSIALLRIFSRCDVSNSRILLWTTSIAAFVQLNPLKSSFLAAIFFTASWNVVDGPLKLLSLLYRAIWSSVNWENNCV